MSRRQFHAWLLRRWYGQQPIWFFTPLAALYAAVTTLRHWCYRHGIFRVVNVAAPVIVVGNITAGGTGKTPFVMWLVQALHAQGYRPGIITRGYRGKSEHWPLRVTPASDPALAGDEAVLLARRTQVPVMASPDRAQAARYLLERFAVNVIVSDDGLQHYRLARDMEILMLDGERGFGNFWRLPAGPLREAASRLSATDIVICKGDPAAAKGIPADCARMILDITHVVRIADGESRPLHEFSGRQVHALAGIANPQQFFAALEAHGLRVDGRALPDHVALSEKELLFDDAAPVLMTEKDAVKCRGISLPHHWYVPAAVRFSAEDAMRILDQVRKRLSAAGVEPETMTEEDFDGR